MNNNLQLLVLLTSVIVPHSAFAQDWTQFGMNQEDELGRFLWSDARNWNRGVPNAKLSVEIGDDNSGKALHCVIPPGVAATCANLELAEHARTQGTTLRLERDASLDAVGSAVLSKDRESWFYVDGHFRCNTRRAGVRVGGPWGKPGINEPSSCHLIIGPGGVFEAWHIGVNTNFRAATAPSNPWGPKYWSGATGSEIVVDGGRLIARNGLRMSTTDAKQPGTLRLKGRATLEIASESEMGLEIWCGIWEINGGQVRIKVGDVEFHGNKFADAVNGKTGKAVGTGVTTLKLSGDGISTIHARKLNFVDAAELDVSKLKVPAGKYKVFDGESVEGVRLNLAPGTNRDRWKLQIDKAAGDVVLLVEPC